MSVSMQRTLRCTVHWIEDGRPRQGDFLFEDQLISNLTATLVVNLALADAASHAGYALRPGPRAPAWPGAATLTEVGVCDGSRLWLTAPASAPDRATAMPRAVQTSACVINMPGGIEAPIADQGQAITRGWLLEQLPLSRRLIEQWRFMCGSSPYQAVSATAPHCRLQPLPTGPWLIVTDRADVETWLNHQQVQPGYPLPLADGDTVYCGGRDGLPLRIRFVDGIS